MRTDAMGRRRFAAAALAAVAASTSWGCGGGSSSLELTGPEALGRLPEAVAAAVPADSILCLDEARHDGAYRLWILRRPGGSWLSFRNEPKGVERHKMPASALEGVLRSNLPALPAGRPVEPHCRFTHWKLADGAEVRVRELVTDAGWFASVERVSL